MLDFVTGLQILLIVLVAMTFFAGVWIIGVCFDSWGDFIKALTCPDYYALNSIFLRGKRSRYVTDFPNDLRRACLVKDTYYADKPGDKARERKTKLLVRRVLANDTIINEYFREQYFTYKDFLEVKGLCDLLEYDETSELLDELGAHLKDPKLAGAMKELVIEVMTDDLVEFKAGKREAALLKAMNKSECTKVPWEQKDFESQRHKCMSSIRGKNTKPEILVRKGLHARGFRFRLQDKKLPGRPDIVLPKYGVAIMVSGCFWHGHKGCRYATKPKSNVEFWEAKIPRNRHRDEVTNAHLEALGWHVITVWECELRKGSRLEDRLNALAEEIRYAGELKKIKEDEKRQSRVAARKEREELLRKQAELETEINSLYPIPKRVKMDAEDMLTYY